MSLGFFLVGQRNREGLSSPWIGLGTSVALQVIFAVLLFHFAPAIVQRLFKDSTPTRIEDPHEVGVLALRLADVFLWDRALSQTSQVIFHARGARTGLGWDEFWCALAVMVILAAAGTWLFLSGTSWARRFFGVAKSEGAEPGATRFQAIAFSVVGLWILADALPDILVLAAAWIERLRSGEFDAPLRIGLARDWTDALGNMTRVVLGLILLLGSRGLSTIWHRIQERGMTVAHAGLEPKDKHV